MKAREVNFDGLVGLTHHYAGLSFGNEASTKHRFQISNPQLAAKQGLLKMKALADAGFPQAVIPPQERPNVGVLRQLGFTGTDEQVVEKAGTQMPQLLSAASSALLHVGGECRDGSPVGRHARRKSALYRCQPEQQIPPGQ